jgi:hypothetical protein
VELAPGGVLLAGHDREEEGSRRLRCRRISRSVAHHEDLPRGVVGGRRLQGILLRRHFLTHDQTHETSDAVLLPFGPKRREGSGRDAHEIGEAAEFLDRLPHEGEGRHAVDHPSDVFVDRLAPAEDQGQDFIPGLLHRGLEGGVSKRLAALDEAHEGGEAAKRCSAPEHLRSLPEEVERHHEGGKAVDPPPVAVEVHELRGFPGVLADRLEIEVADNVGDEALLVLQFHGVEGTAVGVDADEVGLRGTEVPQGRLGIEHGAPLGSSRERSDSDARSAGQRGA